MDLGGINLFTMEVIGVIVLLAVILFVVARRSKGKETSPERTEQATRELYREEERRREDGTDAS